MIYVCPYMAVCGTDSLVDSPSTLRAAEELLNAIAFKGSLLRVLHVRVPSALLSKILTN